MSQKKITYIWQKPDWPTLHWNSESLIFPLAQARKAQGRILAQADLIGLETQATLVVEEAFATSAIEGEKLDRNSIRSSVARRLGLPTAGLPPKQRHVDGLVEMLLDATMNFQDPLTEQRLCGWQAALFPTGYSGIQKIQVGQWRTGHEPMRVVSGGMGKEKVHYEAPPSTKVPTEIQRFLEWWHNFPPTLDGLLRAGIAHFWFVTIHPFDDGNGRVSRSITDMALSQDENSSRRLYNLSTQIVKERDIYYKTLELCQRGTTDITAWLKWFVEMYTRAIQASETTISKAIRIAKFWQQCSYTELNERQRKAIQKMLESEPQGFEGGINNRKYVSITGARPVTATRDLDDLRQKGILVRNPGGGRSASYSLILD